MKSARPPGGSERKKHEGFFFAGLKLKLNLDSSNFHCPAKVVQFNIFYLTARCWQFLPRQASTATTGTTKSDATVHTTLTTIPEEGKDRERSREGERARQWMFEGKVSLWLSQDKGMPPPPHLGKGAKKKEQILTNISFAFTHTYTLTYQPIWFKTYTLKDKCPLKLLLGKKRKK